MSKETLLKYKAKYEKEGNLYELEKVNRNLRRYPQDEPKEVVPQPVQVSQVKKGR